MKQAGYSTFYAGKYLNAYGNPAVGGVAHVPPGWNRWFGLVGNSKYYDYDVSDNGVRVHYGNTYETDYFTDVVKRTGISWIRNMSKTEPDVPLFMIIATPAPHEPATPAPQYSNRYSNMTSPRLPSWNLHSEDKHWLIRNQVVMGPKIIENSDYAFRHRWMTLLSVDDLVSEIYDTFVEAKKQDNTFFFYFSDHGFHLGEFCMPFDKRQLYEQDIRVPLMVRGPGIPKAKMLEDIALSIDLAPTFIDLAGGSVPETMDGRSLKPLLLGEAPNWRTDFLVEYFGEGLEKLGGIQTCGAINDGYGVTVCDAWNNTYHCVRSLTGSEDSIYCELDDTENFREYYDHTKDPYQLKNIVKEEDPTVIQKLTARLQVLKNCVGQTCRSNNKT
eukprot:TRINITY_DN1682_c0_g1_i2.p1 TRINITY_DN1682_c0_g1~~TRINITY_DN1682_c0_g1_i2.p1  ORF type:complete len:386 (-),score=61.89 TRINITY_DN1682_c0_g1_i2:9-1166(-)